MKWGLVGCGVIGERRAVSLPREAELTACFDPNLDRAKHIQKITGCAVATSLENLFSFKPQAILVATINSSMIEVTKAAFEHGIHVLAEKPAARSVEEILSLEPPSGLIWKVGFNHRFHPAFSDLIGEIQSRKDDPILFIRAQYGNGARLGFDQEWRSRVETAGGGELLDQGVHLVDLANQIIPNLFVRSATVRTLFWKMSVDDNAWGLLENERGQVFSFHASSSEWKNEFRFEVYTKWRKYQWLGLGRSYGPERLVIHTMKPEMGPPHTEERSYPDKDDSWLLENKNFLDAILGKTTAWGTYQDAILTLGIVKSLYEASAAQKLDSHPKWWSPISKTVLK